MEKKNYTLGYHLVAFLDVQGQRDKFRQLKLPKTPEEQASAQQVLKDTAGFVCGLRDMFRTQFNAFEAGILSGQTPTKESLQPHFVGFSDSFVMSVPLRPVGGDMTPIVKIFSALSAASIVMMTSLASKHALRGGIDVGLATEIGPEEIYGTALERAYVLESQHAKYPRVAIGDEFWTYLGAALAEFSNRPSAVSEALCSLVHRIMDLTKVDAGGGRFLDYLGEEMAKVAKPQDAKYIVQPAYDFVVAEQQRFLSTGDSKLSERYRQVRAYFESRLSLWGLAKRV
jgi:hypothetical protein